MSGNKVEVDRLKTIFSSGAPLASQTLEEVADKHQIAGAIKKVGEEEDACMPGPAICVHTQRAAT